MRKNKLISLFLAFALIITCFPAMVFADDAEAEDNSSEIGATAIEDEVEILPEKSASSDAKNVNADDLERDNYLWYYLDRVNRTAQVYDWYATLNGTFRIPDYFIALDGQRYPVTSIDFDALLDCGLSSVTVPAGVTSIYTHALGYYQTSPGVYVKIAGFTIFGTNGTEAQAYARRNGFNFRDLAAEEAARKEAARQGVRSSKIAKMKISSIKPAKKSFTVKWKKLSKKQIKKGKVNKYEIWVCKNKSFGPYDTSMHLISKKYGALKLKGATRKTTYYVKIRAVRYTGGVKYVGKWSKIKKVRTQ